MRSNREGGARDNGGTAGVGVRDGQRVGRVTRIRRGRRTPGNRGSGGGRRLCGVVGSIAAGVYVGVVMRPAGDRRAGRIRNLHREGAGRRIRAVGRRNSNRVRSDREGVARSNSRAAGIGVRDGNVRIDSIRRGGRAPGDRSSGRGGSLGGVIRAVAAGVYVGVVMCPAGDRWTSPVSDHHVEGTSRLVAAVIRRSNGNRRRSDSEGRTGSVTVSESNIVITNVRSSGHIVGHRGSIRSRRLGSRGSCRAGNRWRSRIDNRDREATGTLVTGRIRRYANNLRLTNREGATGSLTVGQCRVTVALVSTVGRIGISHYSPRP